MSNAFLRHVAAVLFVVALIMGAWLAVPSKLFFNPHGVQIDGGRVTVLRSFPLAERFGLPYPVVAYREVVRPLSGELPPCIDRDEFRYRNDKNLPYGQWDIKPWAARCMAGGYIWRSVWTVKIFGIIPLRPAELEHVVIEP